MSRSLHVLFFVAFFFSAIAWVSRASAAGDIVSCDCEPVACAPCEVESGVSFYSAKCGPGLERVKSCKKSACVAVENQKQCLALLGGSKVNETAREPASRKEPLPRAGVIEQFEGAALVIHASGPTEAPRKDLVLFNGDIIETKTNGKVRARLSDGSEMTIAPNSRVGIDNVQVNEEKGTRKIALNLLIGKVRGRVTKKYEGDNSFTVKTKTAVAGVRGTDFIASFEPGEKEWVSEVHTIEGLVHFDRVRAGTIDPLKSGSGVDIPVGTYASLTIGPPSRIDSEEEFFKSIEAGKMSPVFKIKDEDIDALKESTEFAANGEAGGPAKARAAKAGKNAKSAAAADSVCSAPAGQFNQCSFTCEGAAKGAKSCQTDRPGITCVRRLCSANGNWTQPARLPASESQRCDPGHQVVSDCGGYW